MDQKYHTILYLFAKSMRYHMVYFVTDPLGTNHLPPKSVEIIITDTMIILAAIEFPYSGLWYPKMDWQLMMNDLDLVLAHSNHIDVRPA